MPTDASRRVAMRLVDASKWDGRPTTVSDTSADVSNSSADMSDTSAIGSENAALGAGKTAGEAPCPRLHPRRAADVRDATRILPEDMPKASSKAAVRRSAAVQSA